MSHRPDATCTLHRALKLSLDRGQRRAAARAEWFAAQDSALEVDGMIAD